MMKASHKAYDIIQLSESCILTAYKCPAGIWTIGYGHTLGVYESMVIGPTTANLYLKQDVQEVENYINKLKLNLNQNQFDALISFVFNLGIGNFKNSTLYKYIRKDVNDPRICQAFCMWIKAGKLYLKGLSRRRLAEATLYFI